MTRHITAGVAAVVGSARQAETKPGRDLWVDAVDAPAALRQIQKLSGEKYPTVETYTHTDMKTDRLCLQLR